MILYYKKLIKYIVRSTDNIFYLFHNWFEQMEAHMKLVYLIVKNALLADMEIFGSTATYLLYKNKGRGAIDLPCPNDVDLVTFFADSIKRFVVLIKNSFCMVECMGPTKCKITDGSTTVYVDIINFNSITKMPPEYEETSIVLRSRRFGHEFVVPTAGDELAACDFRDWCEYKFRRQTWRSFIMSNEGDLRGGDFFNMKMAQVIKNIEKKTLKPIVTCKAKQNIGQVYSILKRYLRMGVKMENDWNIEFYEKEYFIGNNYKQKDLLNIMGNVGLVDRDSQHLVFDYLDPVFIKSGVCCVETSCPFVVFQPCCGNIDSIENVLHWMDIYYRRGAIRECFFSDEYICKKCAHWFGKIYEIGITGQSYNFMEQVVDTVYKDEKNLEHVLIEEKIFQDIAKRRRKRKKLV